MKTIPIMSAKLILLMSAFILMGYGISSREVDTATEENIIVLVKYKAQPDKGVMAVSELTKLIEKVKQEPHFITVKLLVDPKDNTNILLQEEWNDAPYYNGEHMNTAHLQEFIANSRNFLTGPPEISFWKIENEFKK
ncbi:MAG: antibiotic biosynthesis monooxygenase [Flavobacteriaceae bacterium]|nr:MAG: antibiotic biosynthesis monooxygenase [Flavobacteriaceae bacterium]